MKASPQLNRWRPAVGIAPRITDAELITVSVMQALLGYHNESRWVRYGYCASHSRLFWGLRLHLVTTVHGLPVAFALTNAKTDEREVLIDLVSMQPNMFHHPDGLILVVDKGYRDSDTETWLNESG